MSIVILVIAIPVAVVLVAWMGSRMLGGDGPSTSSGNPLGGFNVFEPARERAEEDLESKKQTVVAMPADDDGDQPMIVNTATNTVRIRRPK